MFAGVTETAFLRYEIGSDCPSVPFFQKFSDIPCILDGEFVNQKISSMKAEKQNGSFSPNGLSVECLFICRSRLASFAKTLKQTLHINILTPSWILPCDVRSTDVVNACPHT